MATLSAGAFTSVVAVMGFVASSQASAIRVGETTLAPFEHTMFCLSYPRDCLPRAGDLPLDTAERYAELDTINREINASIAFLVDKAASRYGRYWRVDPASGDCNDYAVTKRHYLLRRGWPSAALLLAEVVLKSGEHHLVLVVKMKNAVVVLDNLETRVVPMKVALRTYRWSRIESEQNPKFWNAVAAN